MFSNNPLGPDIPLTPSPSPPPPAASAPVPNPAPHPAAPAPAAPPADESFLIPDPDEAVRAQLESQVRTVLDKMFDVASYVTDVPQDGEDGVQMRVQDTVRSLADLMNLAPRINHRIPEDVIELIDTGRNPDQHTRSNLTRLANDNQQMLGQNMALGEYQDQLHGALVDHFPEMEAFLSPSANGALVSPSHPDPSTSGA